MKNPGRKRRADRMAKVLREYLQELGRRGGKARTAGKAAARENGKLGGRRKKLK